MQCSGPKIALKQGNIQNLLLLLPQVGVQRVTDDTDDFGVLIVQSRRRKVPAHRILSRPVFLRHSLVDHSNAGRALAIAQSEFAATDQGRADGREKRWTDSVDIN